MAVDVRVVATLAACRPVDVPVRPTSMSATEGELGRIVLLAVFGLLSCFPALADRLCAAL